MTISSEISGETNTITGRQHDPRRKDRRNVGPLERLISMVGGGGLALYGISRLKPSGFLLALLGGEMIRRGITGHDYLYQLLDVSSVEESPHSITAQPDTQRITVRRAMTIERPASDLYAMWRDVELAPLYMHSVESVKRTGEKTSHWRMIAPGGKAVEWESEIMEDIPDQRIAWRTISGTPLAGTAGRVHFTPAPEKNGTIVSSEIDYKLPGGDFGLALGKLFGKIPEQEVREDLRCFKQLMEAGEIPTITGQPTGKGQPLSNQGHKS